MDRKNNQTDFQQMELIKLSIWPDNKPDAQFFSSSEWEVNSQFSPDCT